MLRLQWVFFWLLLAINWQSTQHNQLQKKIKQENGKHAKVNIIFQYTFIHPLLTSAAEETTWVTSSVTPSEKIPPFLSTLSLIL